MSAATGAPWPLESRDLERTFARAAQGSGFRAALEALLLELDDPRAELLQLLLREGRAAWLTQLASAGGRALFVGNAFSGTITALALQGFDVAVLDPVEERTRFAAFRAREQTPGRVEIAREPAGLFRLVVLEEGLPSRAQELARFERLLEPQGELVLVADNRLGYKRSLGKKGEFRVSGPLGFAQRALAPAAGERTLHGYRRALELGRVRSIEGFALYPHRLDYSHVVALDRPHPALTIGPLEKKNRIKLAGKALGLFPVLAPSFALVARLGELQRTRLERVLGALAQRLGEPLPEVETVVATRGNSAVVHTHRGAAWTLHIPLAPKVLPQMEHHMRTLRHVRERFPGVPVPEPLFSGTLEGLSFCCERRLPGWSAPRDCGIEARRSRTLAQIAEILPRLVVRAAQPLDEATFEAQIAARFRIVREHAAVPATIARLEELLAQARDELIGKSLPLVFYHADLRAKHVQVDEQGNVLGILDWGTAEAEGLPYFDLLQLLVHERKQEYGCSVGEAWRGVCARAIRDYEREALERYCAALGLDGATARAIEQLFPVLVAAMAEKNWDYSRPRWLQRQFGIG
jgi:aminoglycoside phosphotransferase (APT) family kinase protein